MHILRALYSFAEISFPFLTVQLLSPFRPELDACDSPDKYPQLFHVILEIEIQSTDRQTELTPPWENFTTKDINPTILFSSHQEHQDTLALAGESCIDLFNLHAYLHAELCFA